ncbi:hypothetical protein [Chryseobacterium sp. MMS23-Vi53]|uniref:hypothetical protein n=1 Tax=Chryseobacterium sp. MMS23-Vi53 TaxID=3386644 RepID=UPI0039E8BEE9
MKKIFYVPGLISALLVPVLFWYYINPYVDKTKYNVTDFGLPPKLEKDKSNLNSTLEPPRNWNYKKIIVDPAKAKQNSAFYVSEVKNLQKRIEKNTGIEFILNENNTYEDFASLINDMAIAKHENYGLDIEETGHLFVPVIYKDPNAKKEECLLCNDVIIDYYEPTFIEMSDYLKRQYYLTFFENMSKLPQEAYYIVFGFLFLMNMSMLSIKERFQLQRFSLIK